MEGGESKVSSRYLMHLFSYVYCIARLTPGYMLHSKLADATARHTSTRYKKIRDKFEAQNELAVVPFGFGLWRTRKFPGHIETHLPVLPELDQGGREEST
jgi:hypothetical protein